MSDRPTPETDAAVDDTAFEDKNQLHTDWVTAFFARKLERERDEAREQWKQQNEALITLALHGDAEIQRLTKERDEAREELRKLKNTQ